MSKIALSLSDIKVTIDSGEIYSVSKFSDDDDTMVMFVHNQNKQSDRYGYFFCIYDDGAIMTQDDDSEILYFDSLVSAFEHITENKQDAHAAVTFYQPAFMAHCQAIEGFDLSALSQPIPDKDA